MTQAPERTRHGTAGAVVVATRLLTLFIAAAMSDLSAQGEQKAAKFGLTLVTVGTLLLSPDALKVLVKFGSIRLPRWISWNSLSRFYQGILIGLGVVAVAGMTFGVTRQVTHNGSLDETSTVIYLIGVAALSALVLIGLLPWWVVTSAQDIAGGPDELREGSKKLLAYIEAQGWPTILGGLLFLGGTGLQFAAISLS